MHCAAPPFIFFAPARADEGLSGSSVKSGKEARQGLYFALSYDFPAKRVTCLKGPARREIDVRQGDARRPITFIHFLSFFPFFLFYCAPSTYRKYLALWEILFSIDTLSDIEKVFSRKLKFSEYEDKLKFYFHFNN